MSLNIKIAKDERILGQVRHCPLCRNLITTNGEVYYNEDTESWSAGYWCPYDKEILRIWAEDIAPILNEITKELDPQTLPKWYGKYDDEGDSYS
jgi:hypothetical protein